DSLLPFLLLLFCTATPATLHSTLSLHDALPIFVLVDERGVRIHKLPSTPEDPSRAILRGLADLGLGSWAAGCGPSAVGRQGRLRSEEHTSELQSRSDLVCRLLLEKKKGTGYATP